MASLPADPRFAIGETALWGIALNTDQALLGRCYLALQRPETDVAALTDGELSDLWTGVRRVKSVLDALWEPDHYNYAFLMNVDPQVHFHVIPRYRDRREFAGGTFTDPAFGKHYTVGPERRLDDAILDTLLATLRDRLARTA